MPDEYTVAFTVLGEQTKSSFETKERAAVFARDIEGIGYEPQMFDTEMKTYDYQPSPPVPHQDTSAMKDDPLSSEVIEL
jgi:hypothetical protein